jgi:hypothetical protein
MDKAKGLFSVSSVGVTVKTGEGLLSGTTGVSKAFSVFSGGIVALTGGWVGPQAVRIKTDRMSIFLIMGDIFDPFYFCIFDGGMGVNCKS